MGNVYWKRISPAVEKPQIKRINVYEEIYLEVKSWGIENNIRTPNNKENFPMYLKKYIDNLRRTGGSSVRVVVE